MTREELSEWWSRTKSPIFSASREVSINAIVALTPVWAGILLSLMLQEISSFWPAVRANTARGDLFLLATATIAPLTLYISVRPAKLPRPLTIHFPGGWFFIFGLIVLFGASALLFAIKRISDLPASSIKIDHDLFLQMSFVIYALSIMLSLVVTAIKYYVDDSKPEQLFREDTIDLINSWKRRRK